MVISKEELVGHWQSIKVKNRLDYGVNWNMTDYWVSGASAKLEITMDSFLLVAPAMDYSTKVELELRIVVGTYSIIDQKIIITEEDRVLQFSILDFNNTILSLHLFKTDAVFENTSVNLE